MYTRSIASALAALLCGCVATQTVHPLSLTDPANPNAAEAPLPPTSNALSMNSQEANVLNRAAGLPSPEMSDDMGGMKMSGMKPNLPGMQHGKMHGGASNTQHVDTQPATQAAPTAEETNK